MTAANSLSLILRRLDEFERKLDRILGRATDAHGHWLFSSSGKSSEEGLNRPGLILAGDGLLA